MNQGFLQGKLHALHMERYVRSIAIAFEQQTKDVGLWKSILKCFPSTTTKCIRSKTGILDSMHFWITGLNKVEQVCFLQSFLSLLPYHCGYSHVPKVLTHSTLLFFFLFFLFFFKCIMLNLVFPWRQFGKRSCGNSKDAGVGALCVCNDIFRGLMWQNGLGEERGLKQGTQFGDYSRSHSLNRMPQVGCARHQTVRIKQ